MKPGRPKIADGSTERMIEMCGQGLSANQIAKEAGVSRNVVISRLRRSGHRLHGKPFPPNKAPSAELERMITLRDEGYSASQIARMLGGGLSRNAVIGRLHRAEVTLMGKREARQARPTPIEMPGPKIRAEPFKPRLVETAPPVLLADGSPVTTLTIHDGKCRYPVSGTGAATQLCANPVFTGLVYCEAHALVCYDYRATARKRAHGQ